MNHQVFAESANLTNWTSSANDNMMTKKALDSLSITETSITSADWMISKEPRLSGFKYFAKSVQRAFKSLCCVHASPDEWAMLSSIY